MIVVPFETWHFNFLELEGPEKQMIQNYGKNWENVVQYLYNSGATYSWFDGEKIIGICGVMPYWNGVGEAYMFLSPDFKTKKKRCIRDIKYYLDLISGQFKFHRVDCHVIKSFEDAIKIAKYLGFKHEATLEKFGPNKEDYIKMVRFYE